MKIALNTLFCLLLMSFSCILHAQEKEKKRDHFYLEVGVGTGYSTIYAREALSTSGSNHISEINIGLRLFEFSDHLFILGSGINHLSIYSDLMTNDGNPNGLNLSRDMIPLRLQWQTRGRFAPHFSLAGYYSFDNFNLYTFPDEEFLMSSVRRNSVLWGFSGGFVYNIPETRNQFKLTVSNIIDPNRRTAYGIITENTSFTFSLSRYLF